MNYCPNKIVQIIIKKLINFCFLISMLNNAASCVALFYATVQSRISLSYLSYENKWYIVNVCDDAGVEEKDIKNWRDGNWLLMVSGRWFNVSVYQQMRLYLNDYKILYLHMLVHLILWCRQEHNV